MKKSKIEWTEATWNPHYGCRKVSPGCKFCYMFRDRVKLKGLEEDKIRIVQKSKTTFNDPLHWKTGKLVFTCSWSDFFIEDADEWRDECWEIIKQTPHHQYQILTKRPERINDCLPADWNTYDYGHVWIGVSVENNEMLYKVDELKKVDANIRFLSVEPLIENVRLTPELLDGIHWVIIGGESGDEPTVSKYNYRPCSISWVNDIIIDCKNANVPVFVKQMGTHIARKFNYKSEHGSWMHEFPRNMQVREFPIDVEDYFQTLE